MTTARTRAARLEARATADQKALIEEAAALVGRSLTDFVLAAALAEARHILAEERILRLSRADTRAFVAALQEPPAPSPALIQAGDLARQLVVREGPAHE